LGPKQVPVKSEDARFIEHINELIEARISEISVEDLAYAVSLSPKQLNRRLQSILGMSTIGHITKMRLERAAQLLEKQAYRVAEVGYKVGYSDSNYFTRVFRQTFGVPPSSYKDSLKDK
jgi:transcriptional regulator GlxA family with amidase domain